MSHFTVLVIDAADDTDVETALFPFWELDMSCETMIEHVQNGTDDRIQFSPEIPLCELESKFKKWHEEEKSKYKDDYKTAKDWVENYYEYYLDEKKLNYGFYHNPNAKWDWYQIGGRWSGYFQLKEGKTETKGKPNLLMPKEELDEIDGYDIASMGDIDWKKTIEKCYRPFAVVKDGKWYGKGRMGWFGISSGNKEEDNWQKEFDELLSDVKEDTMMALIDCHI